MANLKSHTLKSHIGVQSLVTTPLRPHRWRYLVHVFLLVLNQLPGTSCKPEDEDMMLMCVGRLLASD